MSNKLVNLGTKLLFQIPNRITKLILNDYRVGCSASAFFAHLHIDRIYILFHDE